MEAGTFGICETCTRKSRTSDWSSIRFAETAWITVAAEKRALEHDLDIAYQIQSGLLPKPGPVATGLDDGVPLPTCRPVSGDYCDLIRLDDGSGLFILGDVMGKESPRPC